MDRGKTTKNETKPSGLKGSGAGIVLGVTGGISAYKAVDLASRLAGEGAVVRTVMTSSACELIRPKSFEAVTNSAVYTSLWECCPADDKIVHIKLADWADLIVVAPATADIIGKAANGICDDLLSTLLCAMWEKPILFAPAMNEKMWKNPAVQENVKVLKKRGIKFVGPVTGRLACGTEGIGRMSEPEEIMKAVEKVVSKIKRRTK
jgi:phosphopantothenoylcysteine decarboxylase/phosphopantothenate--cysteine ligase